jgi:hypothetical protein
MNANTPNTAPRSLPRLRHVRTNNWQRFVYSQRMAERSLLPALALIAILAFALWQLLTNFREALPLPVDALVIGLILTALYFASASILNSTAITVDATHMTIDGRPMPMPNRMRAPLNSIAVIDYRVSSNDNGKESHRVVAVLRNRDEFEVMHTADADIAQRIALELERHRRSNRVATTNSDLRSA